MWYDIKTAADMLQITKDTLYSNISKDKAKGLSYRFKKNGRSTLVNIETYYRHKVTYETQKAFEELYFELIELLPAKRHLYRMIGNITGKTEQAVCQYFFQMFISGSEPMKKQYIKAMQQIKQGLQ